MSKPITKEELNELRTCPECGKIGGGVVEKYLRKRLETLRLSADEIDERYPLELTSPVFEVEIAFKCECGGQWFYKEKRESGDE